MFLFMQDLTSIHLSNKESIDFNFNSRQSCQLMIFIILPETFSDWVHQLFHILQVLILIIFSDIFWPNNLEQLLSIWRSQHCCFRSSPHSEGMMRSQSLTISVTTAARHLVLPVITKIPQKSTHKIEEPHKS